MYNFNDVRKNENKGFSLVELIVVIAIMAVMTSVLAPALLQYVERSRAQKDDSAMGEVTNAIMLALSDQEIYDEVLCYACTGNVSCYVDSEASISDANKVQIKAATNGGGNNASEIFEYNDNTRQKDEVEYLVAGQMRGVTITFYPAKNTNASQYTLSEGVVNAFVRKTDKKDDHVAPADALLRSYARFCQTSAKEKRCNPQKKITTLSKPYSILTDTSYLPSVSTSAISFAVALTIRMPVSLIPSRSASSCRRCVFFSGGVSKRNWSTDIL